MQVWPEPDSDFPPSRIATIEAGHKLRLAFGSCRKSAPHDEENTTLYGIDAMRAYGLHMMSDDERWPDLLVLLGDQVYADETSEEMREFIAARRNIDEPPGEELKDYEEYAYLYHLAWTEPANRWLLSTLPSAMIFDDHDIRDDWNTSAAWRQQMHATEWWQGRIVAGLASYWVYQHLGNLSPAERASDEIWKQILASRDLDDDVDLGPVLDDFAARVDVDADSYRWSYSRDMAGSRLIVVDSRAARVLDPNDRRDAGPSGAFLARRAADGWRRPRLHRQPRCPFSWPPDCTTSRRGTRQSQAVRGGDVRSASVSGCDKGWTWSTGRRSRRASGR